MNAKQLVERAKKGKRVKVKQEIAEFFDVFERILFSLKNEELLKKELSKLIKTKIPENYSSLIKRGKNYVALLLPIKEEKTEKSKLIFFYNGALAQKKLNLKDEIIKVEEFSTFFKIALGERTIYYEKSANELKEKKY